MTKQEIGAILFNLREKAGKSREEVSELLGKSVKTIGHWETGYAQPDANTLFLLCTIYNADISEAFGFTTTKGPANQSVDEARKRVLNELLQMPPEEFELVKAFIQGLRAKRREG